MKKIHLRKWKEEFCSGLMHKTNLQSPEPCLESIHQLDGHLGSGTKCSPISAGCPSSSADALQYTTCHTYASQLKTPSAIFEIGKHMKNSRMSLTTTGIINTALPISSGCPSSSADALQYTTCHSCTSQLKTHSDIFEIGEHLANSRMSPTATDNTHMAVSITAGCHLSSANTSQYTQCHTYPRQLNNYLTISLVDEQMTNFHMTPNAPDNVNIPLTRSNGFTLPMEKCSPLIPYHNNSCQLTSHFTSYNVYDIENSHMSPSNLTELNTAQAYHHNETPTKKNEHLCSEIELLRRRPNLEIYRVTSNTTSIDLDSITLTTDPLVDNYKERLISHTKSKEKRQKSDGSRWSSSKMSAGGCSDKTIENQNRGAHNTTETPNGRPRKT